MRIAMGAPQPMIVLKTAPGGPELAMGKPTRLSQAADIIFPAPIDSGLCGLTCLGVRLTARSPRALAS